MSDADRKLLDSIVAAAERWDSEVVGNPVVKADAELSGAANRIADLIGDFYQLAGRKRI